MKYEYDVFISYKRYGEWTGWVCETFKGVLDSHLSNALGRPAGICTDKEIEGGADWPDKLRQQLATSRVLVPLFSKMYFGSGWCLRELYAFRYKEVKLGLRTSQKPNGIIVPARIHDGMVGDLPEHLHDCCRIQAEDLTEYALTSLKTTTERYARFEVAIRSWVERSIKPAIDTTRQLQLQDSWLEEISGLKFDCPNPANYDDLYPGLA